MDRSLRKYVSERLRTFEREDVEQLRLQTVHAQAQGQQVSEVFLPLAFDSLGRKRGLYDMFDVEIALLLFGREPPTDAGS